MRLIRRIAGLVCNGERADEPRPRENFRRPLPVLEPTMRDREFWDALDRGEVTRAYTLRRQSATKK
jgi:hypothetical protein